MTAVTLSIEEYDRLRAVERRLAETERALTDIRARYMVDRETLFGLVPPEVAERVKAKAETDPVGWGNLRVRLAFEPGVLDVFIDRSTYSQLQSVENVAAKADVLARWARDVGRSLAAVLAQKCLAAIQQGVVIR